MLKSVNESVQDVVIATLTEMGLSMAHRNTSATLALTQMADDGIVRHYD